MFKGHADQKDLAALVETTDKHSNRLNCRRNVCSELSGNTRPQRRLGLVTHGNQIRAQLSLFTQHRRNESRSLIGRYVSIKRSLFQIISTQYGGHFADKRLMAAEQNSSVNEFMIRGPVHKTAA